MNIGEANAVATLLYHVAGMSRPGSGPVGAVKAGEAARFLAARVDKVLMAGPDAAAVVAGIEAAAIGQRLPETAAMAVNALLGFLLDPHAIDPSDEEAARYGAQLLADWTATTGHTAWTPERVAAAWPHLLTGCPGCPTCAPGGSPAEVPAPASAPAGVGGSDGRALGAGQDAARAAGGGA